MKSKGKKRHIAKTITWRIVATFTTFLLAISFFNQDPDATEKASWLSITEVILKMFFFYYHERLWFSVKYKIKNNTRHMLKTISWRVIASLTTFVLAYLFFSKDPQAIAKASSLTIVEIFFKMILYYFHEKAWHLSKFGLK